MSFHVQRQQWQALVDNLGLNERDISNNRQLLREYINLKLMALGISPINEIAGAVASPSPYSEV